MIFLGLFILVGIILSIAFARSDCECLKKKKPPIRDIELQEDDAMIQRTNARRKRRRREK